MVPAVKLIQAWPTANQIWISAVVDAMPRFGINTPVRESAFLAQVYYESMGFTKFEESLYYKDPARIAQIFRTAFDLDKNKVIDQTELDFAKQYVKNPQKLANRAYANKLGNGDEASGDGWKFRGRGPIQITFHDNYQKACFWTGVNVVADPDELLVPRNGCSSACGFWRDAKCNELADVGDHREITRRINPGLAGLDERLALVPVIRKIIDN